jgi:hypothetical protein
VKFKSKPFVIIVASFIGLISSNLSMANEYQFTTGVMISGLIQVEARFDNGYDGKDTSDFVVDELDIGIEARVHKFAKAKINLLYEQEGTPLEIDEAFLTLGNSKVSPFFLTVGQQYLPFGNFESHMVSDSLTLEIGEARETALQMNAEYNGLYGSLFAFNGSTQDNPITGTGEDKIDHYGLNLGFASEIKMFGYDVGLSYINDIGDSDGVTRALDARASVLGLANAAALTDYQYVNALGTHVILNMRQFSFIGEYIGTLGSFNVNHLNFNNQGAVLQAWNTELGYSLNILGKKASLALGYQGTKEALALGLPKNRYLIGLSVGIYDQTTFSFEYAHEQDYNSNETGNANKGTGNSKDRATLQLVLEF